MISTIKYRVNTLVYTLLLLVFFSNFEKIFANDLAEVEKLVHFLENKGKTFLVFLENFEGDTPWKITKSTSSLQITSFVPKVPESKGFQKEGQEFKDILVEERYTSLMVHSNLEIPDREKIIFEPKQKKILPYGLPVRVFVWVHSENYQCKLFVNFQYRGKEKRVDLGDLQFSGWKRMEKSFYPLKEFPRILDKRKDLFSLQDFQVHCLKSQPRGTITLYLDRLSVLMEKPNLEYPGMEIEDGWTFKD